MDSTDIQFTSCTTIPSYPKHLKGVKLVDSENVTRITGFPDSIEKIYIKNCPSLLHIPEFPESLSELVIVDCLSLLHLPDFPENLSELEIINCPSLTELPPLPSSLSMLHINRTPIKTFVGDELCLNHLALFDTKIEIIPDVGLPSLELENNPFHLYYDYSLSDMDPNQVDDFFIDYKERRKKIIQKLAQGISFDDAEKQITMGR